MKRKTDQTAGFIFLAAASFIAAMSEVFYRLEESFRMLIPRWGIYFLFLLAVSYLAERLCTKAQDPDPGNRFRKLFCCTKRNIFHLFLVYYGIFLIYALISYPGVCGKDTLTQINDLLTGTKPLPFGWITGQVKISALMNDHHPVFDTLIFTLFYKIGDLFGKPNLGMFLFVLIQSGIMAYLFADIVCSLERFGCSFHLQLVSAAFYCLPFIAYFAIAMIKDSLFAAVFVVYFRIFIAVFMALRKKAPISRREWLILITASVLIALTNKKGIYIAVVSNLSLLVLSGRNTRSGSVILSAMLPFLIVSVLIRQVLFPVFNIYPGGKQEALGFTFPQIALTYMTQPDSFSESDKQILSNILTVSPEQYPGIYEAYTSDFLKGKYNFYASAQDIADYLLLWLKTGIRHPLLYLKATMRINGGYFSPAKTINIYHEIPKDKNVRLGQHAKLADARAFLRQHYDWISAVPGISLFFQDTLYMFWIPVIMIFNFIRKNKRSMIPALTPILVNILFLIMGPVCWTRYGLCQIYTIPLLAAVGLQSRDPL